MKAFLTYYLTVNCFNLPAAALIAIISGNGYWLPVVFCTFGLGIGVLCYNFYFRNQYYFYHNLGYTKSRLIITTFIFNVVLSLPLLAILALL